MFRLPFQCVLDRLPHVVGNHGRRLDLDLVGEDPADASEVANGPLCVLSLTPMGAYLLPPP
jgi:hypothetical protein